MISVIKSLLNREKALETTLHKQLKDEFCDPDAELEVKLDRYRIDVVSGDRLIEIQRSSLSSIRDKIQRLLKLGFTVDVVKPLVTRKRLVKLNKKGGSVVDSRWSPKRGTILDDRAVELLPTTIQWRFLTSSEVLS